MRHQWFKNGDHPMDGDPTTEGDLVRYFRNPLVDGTHVCAICGFTMHEHGFIDDPSLCSYHTMVCPGSFVTEYNGCFRRE